MVGRLVRPVVGGHASRAPERTRGRGGGEGGDGGDAVLLRYARHLRFVSLYLGGYAGLVAVALVTHALVGYTLGTISFDRPVAGLVGSVAPDIDLLFPVLFPAAVGWPFVHRGITHTLLVAVIATAIVAARGRATAGAFGVGYASHLLIDTTTPKGVPHLYPLTAESFHVDFGTTGHSPLPTVALIGGCLLVLWFRRRESPGRSSA